MNVTPFSRISRAKEVRELILLVSAILILLTLGTTGFALIEGWSVFDAFYMTVITLSTVGYGETHPLSVPGRAFTILLIGLGVGVATIALTALTQNVIQRQLLSAFDRRKMREAIRRIKDHTIICGYGRLSRIAAKELRAAKVPVVIVEKDEARAIEAEGNGFLVVRGDATTDETLIEGGVERATRLVSLLPKDADNLYVVLTSRELAPELFILSRAEDEAGEKRLTRAGANKVISPYRLGGQKIADGILRPYVMDFIDLAVSGSTGELQIEEIRIPEASPLGGFTLQDSALRQKTNVIIAAIISKSGEMQFNPSGSTVIEPSATLIGFGFKKDLAVLEELLLGRRAKT